MELGIDVPEVSGDRPINRGIIERSSPASFLATTKSISTLRVMACQGKRTACTCPVRPSADQVAISYVHVIDLGEASSTAVTRRQ